MRTRHWTKEFHRHYWRVINHRRRSARLAGGMIAAAVAGMGDSEVYDPVCWDYVVRLHIEFDLCGPKTIIGSAMAPWRMRV